MQLRERFDDPFLAVLAVSRQFGFEDADLLETDAVVDPPGEPRAVVEKAYTARYGEDVDREHAWDTLSDIVQVLFPTRFGVDRTAHAYRVVILSAIIP